MTEQTERKIIFHGPNERGEIKLCKLCQSTPHYCNILTRSFKTDGCIAFCFLPDLKTVRWLIPFSWEELWRGYTYTSAEYHQLIHELQKQKQAEQQTQ